MSTVLVVNSSATGGASVSKALIDGAVAGLAAQDPGLRVVTRDLGTSPVPHLTAETVPGIRDPLAGSLAAAAARALSDTLIAELEAADVVVIGAPMYNFGIPSTLKAWFDHVLRPGRTFRYGTAGPEGLLKGRRAIVVESRGGLYSEGPAQGMDGQEPHLRTLLGFIGITDVAFVRAERLGLGPDARAQAIAGARAELERLAERSLPRAA
jgi:FMN-dependent NADH-azoreductase